MNADMTIQNKSGVIALTSSGYSNPLLLGGMDSLSIPGKVFRKKCFREKRKLHALESTPLVSNQNG